jgi:hypothetical protein
VFECERITHVPLVPAVPERTDEKIVYVFFEYPTAEFRRDLELPTKDVKTLSGDGYRVKSIEGFTSPEGPRDPRNLRDPKAFEGNIELAEERAKAAAEWLGKACPECDLSGVEQRGRSELPPDVGAAQPETSGPSMEHEAVEEFLGQGPDQKPDPLAPHDAADIEAFRRLPRREQRERAFKLMRRAAITFTKVVQQAKAEVPARDDPNRVDCDPDVIEAARKSFGISVVTGAKVLP